MTTRHNQECMAEAGLLSKGYQVFLPKYAKPRTRCGTTQPSELPLFPGYLFCYIPSDVRGRIVSTPGVLGFVRFGRCPTPVDDHEIENIQLLLKSGWPREPWRYCPTGTRIRIDSGPFKGRDGTLVTTNDTKRLVVSISLLQRSVAAILDHDTEFTVLSRPYACAAPKSSVYAA